jgi:metallophosphoesterase superfamily enzyme
VSTVLAIPDLHAPFAQRGFIEWCRQIGEYFSCDTFVQIGDLVDNHALSRWPKHPDADTVAEEVRLAKDILAELYDAFPGGVKLTLGNHDERLKKRLYDLGIPEQFGTSYREMYQIPDNWEIYENSVEIDGVVYYHGHRKGGQMPALGMAQLLGKPVVCGHHHGVAGVNKRMPNGQLSWGMDLGCGVDISSYGMYYAKETLMQPVLGCGVVVDGIPHHFIFGEKPWL